MKVRDFEETWQSTAGTTAHRFYALSKAKDMFPLNEKVLTNVRSVNPRVLVELAVLSREDLAGIACCYTPSTVGKGVWGKKKVGSRSHDVVSIINAVRAQCQNKTHHFLRTISVLQSDSAKPELLYQCFIFSGLPRDSRSKTTEAKRNGICHICCPLAKPAKVTVLFANR